MISSELPEVLGMADRILVMREGRIVLTAAPSPGVFERIVADVFDQLLDGLVLLRLFRKIFQFDRAAELPRFRLGEVAQTLVGIEQAEPCREATASSGRKFL